MAKSLSYSTHRRTRSHTQANNGPGGDVDRACYSVWPNWPTKWKNNRTEGSFMYFIKPSGEYVFKNLSGALMDNRELSWTPYSLIILILECMKTAFENSHVLNENSRLFLWIVLYEYADRCTCSLCFLGLLFCLTAVCLELRSALDFVSCLPGCRPWRVQAV